MRRDHRKNSYERRVYKSVDDKNLSCDIISKIDGKQNSCSKGFCLFQCCILLPDLNIGQLRLFIQTLNDMIGR